MVSPEQSHEFGPAPPYTYGSPTCANANSTTFAPFPDAGMVPVASPAGAAFCFNLFCAWRTALREACSCAARSRSNAARSSALRLFSSPLCFGELAFEGLLLLLECLPNRFHPSDLLTRNRLMFGEALTLDRN
jgi:hypothetical protein